jgi:predicted dehydrogenase
MDSAKGFCDKFGGRPEASYEAVLAADDVDAVYIGLPHHLHAEWTIKAAEAGKAILCEKPFTLTLAEAQNALAAVRASGVFFMEAFMYRCHPQTRLVLEYVRAGVIGEVSLVQAEFGFHAPMDWGNFRADASVGGGALMDVGCYPVSLARAVFGAEPTRCEYAARLCAKGYDEVGSGVLEFPGGRTLHFGTAVHLNLGNQATIYGTTGRIVIEDPWKVAPGKPVSVFKHGTPEPEVLDLSSTNDELYGHEADAVAEFLDAKEAPYMTIDDTLGQMATLDALRHSAGYFFAGERA